jgi:uncharacterized membrane protein
MLGSVGLTSLVFVAVAALPYFQITEGQFGVYWPRRWWLLLHITAGIVALLAGPVQLWLGLTDQRPGLHRRLGMTYVGAVAVSAAAGYYLAFRTSFGWVFGAGLAGLATAWILTTGLALAAIRRGRVEQHKEWMIRSYVVTTAFVTFRMLFTTLEQAGIGTVPERLAAAAWFCWAVPLLFTEAAIQARKIFAPLSALSGWRRSRSLTQQSPSPERLPWRDSSSSAAP